MAKCSLCQKEMKQLTDTRYECECGSRAALVPPSVRDIAWLQQRGKWVADE